MSVGDFLGRHVAAGVRAARGPDGPAEYTLKDVDEGTSLEAVVKLRLADGFNEVGEPVPLVVLSVTDERGRDGLSVAYLDRPRVERLREVLDKLLEGVK